MSISVREVAARAGVSVGTVSNVLNRPEKVAPDTVVRVNDAIAELGFVRNDAARQLRAGRSRAIGLVILDVGNPFFTDVVRGAEDAAAAERMSIILGNSDEKVEREAAYLDLFEQQRMHGVLISPFGEITDRLAALRKRGIPVVLVDRTSTDRSFSSVSVDDVEGGRLAATHLLETGRRRLGFVGGPMEIRQVTDRLRGTRSAIEKVADATLEVIGIDALSVVQGHIAGEEIASRDAADRPDALFAANDLVALGLLQALMNRGISVPRDIAIIGYDDIAFGSAAVVPLSSIRQPSASIGKTAVAILLDEAQDPRLGARHVVFQPELVVRASTRG